MNTVDFDPKVATKDAYGNVTVKGIGETIGHEETYKGFVLDVGIGNVKVWHEDAYMGRFSTTAQAKLVIDAWLER